MTQALLFNVTGQKLVLDLPKTAESIVSLAVYELDASDDSTPESATTGSPALASTGDTTSAACGISQTNPRRIPVADAAGFVAGRRYMLVSGSGLALSEVVELTNVTAGVLTTRHPIRNDYASGSVVADLRVEAAVSSTWIADTANVSTNGNPNPRYRVKWVVSHSDGTAVYIENFDVVRYTVEAAVTPLDVEDAHEGWIDRLSADHRATQGRSHIDEAQRRVRLDLFKRKVPDRALRNAEVLKALVIDCAAMLPLEDNVKHGADREPYEMVRDIYHAHLAALVDTPVAALDTGGSGAADTRTGRSIPLWSR